MSKNIYGVIGANYGDEGKGQTTNFLSQMHPHNTIVVCSNGSSQRGHTVIQQDLRHVFHHFGSGTLNGAHTYFPKDFILNPLMFLKETDEFKKKKIIQPQCFANDNCKVAFIYDMIANQVIELSRTNKHGSCGCGVWETLKRYDTIPCYTIKEIKSLNLYELEQYISECRKYSEKRILNVLENENLTKDIYMDYKSVFHSNTTLHCNLLAIDFMLNNIQLTKDSSFLKTYDTVIFENGQGLLLDRNIDKILSTPSETGIQAIQNVFDDNFEPNDAEINIFYVTRPYITRHGNDNFKEKCNKEDINPEMFDETNQPNPYQGNLMYGKLNKDELKERITNDISKLSVKANYGLAITHTDDYPWENNVSIGNYQLILKE